MTRLADEHKNTLTQEHNKNISFTHKNILHMKVTRFEELECWKAARELGGQIFLVSQDGAFVKDWDSKSQFKRAALSVMNNIAEGFARYHDKEFRRF